MPPVKLDVDKYPQQLRGGVLVDQVVPKRQHAAAARELAAARRLLEDMPRPLTEADYEKRSWNPTGHHRYRGAAADE